MKNSLLSARITLWVNRLIALAVVALVFLLPALVRWYSTVRVLTPTEQTAITAAFYCCTVVILIALWQIDRLLKQILLGQVFTRSNARRIRTVGWCCGTVSLVCVPASVFYLPLVFMTVVMAFLCLVVSVVASVMDAAVTIREENDLTV